MPNYDFLKLEPIDLKLHPELNEKWVQDKIAQDPSILGMGDILLKDKERRQKSGRLDLLLQDPEDNQRYEVELQLGKMDESHIIRTIEYWDIERKRYPQYDHCAVVIAEDVSSRFLNVLGLFNGYIPLKAIQMKAFKIGKDVTLVFTTVMDTLTLGLEEDDEMQEATDRVYWEQRASTLTLEIVDEIYKLILKESPGFELNYNRPYIGLSKDGHSKNFVIFKPNKSVMNLELKINQSKEIDALIEASSLDLIDYKKKWGMYRFRILKENLQIHQGLLQKLIQIAWEENQ